MLAGVRARPTFGNARYVRNLLEAAIGRHAWRLRDVEAPTLEQLRTLELDDLDAPPRLPRGAVDPEWRLVPPPDAEEIAPVDFGEETADPQPEIELESTVEESS